MRTATFVLAAIYLAIFAVMFLVKNTNVKPVGVLESRWKVAAIDTVKYSRDLAREKIDSISFEKEIEGQVRDIANTGASHIAIGTPYDAEFIHFMTKWVKAARRYGLNVWFRGNFSGWEGWFDYSVISREDHKVLLSDFIRNNPNLFEDGDIFSSCPECENGGNGDPRLNGDVNGHRKFLIDEYQLSREEFRLIGKNVASNYYPMNGDVAKLVMDKETTRSLGGIVAVDHYVGSPEELVSDLQTLSDSSGGKIVLAEFGAPIPDIHKAMSEDDQANWIEKTLALLHANDNVIGLSYWTNKGGSTAIWNTDGSPRRSVEVLTRYFSY